VRISKSDSQFVNLPAIAQPPPQLSKPADKPRLPTILVLWGENLSLVAVFLACGSNKTHKIPKPCSVIDVGGSARLMTSYVEKFNVLQNVRNYERQRNN